MNLEDKAREYAEGKSSASVFRDAHIKDFKAGYKQALEDTKASEMLEMLIDIRDVLENGDTPHIYKIDELIKQATEL